MQDRKYIIFDVSEVDKVDFTQVIETSADTLRTSFDGTKTFIKFNTEEAPAFVESLTTKSAILSYSEILEILSTEEWSKLEPIKS